MIASVVFFPRILYYKATNIINSYPGMGNEIELHSRNFFYILSFYLSHWILKLKTGLESIMYIIPLHSWQYLIMIYHENIYLVNFFTANLCIKAFYNNHFNKCLKLISSLVHQSRACLKACCIVEMFCLFNGWNMKGYTHQSCLSSYKLSFNN